MKQERQKQTAASRIVERGWLTIALASDVAGSAQCQTKSELKGRWKVLRCIGDEPRKEGQQPS